MLPKMKPVLINPVAMQNAFYKYSLLWMGTHWDHLIDTFIESKDANPDSFVRGCPKISFFFFFGFSHHILQRGDGVRTNTLSGPLSAQQRKAITMAFR